MWMKVREKFTMLLVAEVGGFTVGCTHLFWDPRLPDLKLLQAFAAAEELGPRCPDAGGGGTSRGPAVLAGDLNSLPGSAVVQLLTTGEVGADHPEHPAALRGVAGCGALRLSAAPFAPAFPGFPVTHAKGLPAFRGCLDYVLVRGARVLRAEPVPEVELLPSDDVPSDHLPLVAELAAI